MFDIDTLLVLIPALPLAAALLTAALGRYVLRGQSHWPAVLAIALSCVASLSLALQVYQDVAPQIEAAAAEAEHAEQGEDADESESTEHGEETAEVGNKRVVTLWTWAAVEETLEQPADPAVEDSYSTFHDFEIEIALRADPLTAFMLVTVTFVSMLVAIYSIGYMRGDPGYWRFFTYIALFVFSMTMLVSSSNFVLLYCFWEAVGLCSYLLIGFWYQKPTAAAAGKKAFLTNRVGDFGFALGVFLIWSTFGTLNFHDTQVIEQTKTVQTASLGGEPSSREVLVRKVIAADREVEEGAKVVDYRPGVLGQTMLAGDGLYEKTYRRFYGDHWQLAATAVCLLLMLGACGKSAQFPLHVWLPDAMEGPTPVSALIHAATMVTAGVYMVARCIPLFVTSQYALQVVAAVGCFTALLGGLIALTQTDLKRILAYSTISQLGYMFLGLGAATLVGVTAGMFHLFTHAFFKALLFLGAGSVMHAMGGVIDVRRFGGLRRVMPWTCGTFLVGCFALSGFPLFAGFFSKDKILEAVHQQPGTFYQVLFYVAVFTALWTAFYTFRAFWLTFCGPKEIPEEAGHHAHESPWSMVVPLLILAVGAIVVGWFFEQVMAFLGQTPSLAYTGLAPEVHGAEHGGHGFVMITSMVVVLVGIAAAVLLYGGGKTLLESLTGVMKSLGLYRLSHSKFFFDEIYDLLIIGPLRALAWVSYWADRYLIDGLVNAIGLAPKLFGAVLRPLQNGLVQFYAVAMLLGLLILIGTLLI
jgi:NADH-quinone oxidoreductase subunit L